MDQASLNTILSGFPAPVVLVGEDSRVVAVNAPAQAMFGTDLTGRHYGLTLRQPELLAAIAAVMRNEGPVIARHVVPGNSQEIVHRVTVSLVGRMAMCVFDDISQEEQIGQMRRDFVANVSHELRTPLTALLGFIETLRGAARDDAVARDRFLAIMAGEAERMNRLVRDLLQLSRVESEERVRPTEVQDLTALIHAAVATLRPMADSAGVAIVTEGLHAAVLVPADADQIMQVLTNLIENAVKYGGSGHQVALKLSRESSARGPMVRIAISDSGEGIDPLHLPRLTERFYRVDDHRSREKGGTGLGLAIVKHIVNRHRGRLMIESTPGVGSTFSVLLPACI